METFLCNDVRLLDENKYTAMIIPCHWLPLAVTKPQGENLYGKCPVCGAKIYVEASGWMGHEVLSQPLSWPACTSCGPEFSIIHRPPHFVKRFFQ